MSEPIRILQVFAEMNRGGAETMIMNLYRTIDRTKVQFDFIVHTIEKCAFDDEIEKLGGKIYRLPKYVVTNHFSYSKAWRIFLNNNKNFNIIHGHMITTASIYLNQAKKKGLITIAHSHSTSSGNGFKKTVKNILKYRIRFIAEYYFACSIDAGKWLYGKKIIFNEKFKVINNSINTKKFIFDNEIRNNMRLKLDVFDKFVIGHIGRFDSNKNQEFLIDIIQEIKRLDHDVQLILVGDGIDRIKIEKKVSFLNLRDKIIFTGIRSDISNLLQAMDLFLLPSKSEGLGVVLIEAQATGLHCIVSDNIPEEAIITDLVTKLPLKYSIDKWVKTILASKNNCEINREKYNELVNKSGYEVKSTALELQGFYLNI
jgi:glycosyltransferase involved in cell wall biosynthesis